MPNYNHVPVGPFHVSEEGDWEDTREKLIEKINDAFDYLENEELQQLYNEIKGGSFESE